MNRRVLYIILFSIVAVWGVLSAADVISKSYATPTLLDGAIGAGFTALVAHMIANPPRTKEEDSDKGRPSSSDSRRKTKSNRQTNDEQDSENFSD